ncbi:MAG: CRISPR-associated endonuclease Cas2 [Prevotella sp.]|jgi:CRISPR-associated protein Cas2|nr:MULTISPECIES: CRISPR-associated endonuclease Cas2 [unclassified Prevotella]MCH3991126.1 CRISPR-associated endonuclease Cas2 [Prevotella sp.]MCI1684819.1 CRISPR-associated endonuclease Cas2 [Prevotella sp.]MCI1815997.1 CRISPR-associated endonuclease Cas2 [Prevotella sp.]MCI1847216.1 CRISPR-associated endonuclease Cas2 [Prevotella sp.]MCI2087040.1 CRISPR-associated endonuclease Cas2 [Prevotella sp.]
MYVILVYDIGIKRVAKMLKLCRQYLCWIQNSVFEGEITEAKLRELVLKMELIMDKNVDSVIIFSNKMGYTMNKQILGKERMPTDNFL